MPSLSILALGTVFRPIKPIRAGLCLSFATLILGRVRNISVVVVRVYMFVILLDCILIFVGFLWR